MTLPLHTQKIPKSVFPKKRIGDPKLAEYLTPLNSSLPWGAFHFVLLGCPDDLGVELNKGRTGARLGPNNIRKYFFKMTPPMDGSWNLNQCKISDAGNIPVASILLNTHQRAFDSSKAISSNPCTLIVLGGGHDFAAPCFGGFVQGKQERTKQKLSFGLLNIDPHLDVRKIENNIHHSGTPFRVLIENKSIKGTHLTQFGTRGNRNCQDNFNFCKKHKVRIRSLDALQSSPIALKTQFKTELTRLTKINSLVGVTLDMDSCFEAEGSSAAPVLGFSTRELIDFAIIAGKNKKVQYFEIAEVAPNLNLSDRSSRIASEILYAFIFARTSG